MCFDIYNQMRKAGKLLSFTILQMEKQRHGDLPNIHSQDLQRGHKKNQFLLTWQILGLIIIANKEWCQKMLEYFELKSISLSTTLQIACPKSLSWLGQCQD